MRLYELYDTLLSFSFNDHYYKGKEYIVVNDDVIDKLYIEEFKKDNFCFSDQFIAEKLNVIKSQINYLQKLIEKGLADFDGKDKSRLLFMSLLKQFQKKGFHFEVSPFNRNVRIIYFLIYDLYDLTINRIKILDALLTSYDFNLEDGFNNYEIIFEERNLELYALKEYPTRPEWFRIRSNKLIWPSIKEDYQFYFKKDALIEYRLLFDANKIQTATKDKVRMFFKLLRDFGYFKRELDNNELAELITAAQPKKFTTEFIAKEKSDITIWNQIYGGRDIPNFL